MIPPSVQDPRRVLSFGEVWDRAIHISIKGFFGLAAIWMVYLAPGALVRGIFGNALPGPTMELFDRLTGFVGYHGMTGVLHHAPLHMPPSLIWIVNGILWVGASIAWVSSLRCVDAGLAKTQTTVTSALLGGLKLSFRAVATNIVALLSAVMLLVPPVTMLTIVAIGIALIAGNASSLPSLLGVMIAVLIFVFCLPVSLMFFELSSASVALSQTGVFDSTKRGTLMTFNRKTFWHNYFTGLSILLVLAIGSNAGLFLGELAFAKTGIEAIDLLIQTTAFCVIFVFVTAVVVVFYRNSERRLGWNMAE